MVDKKKIVTATITEEQYEKMEIIKEEKDFTKSQIMRMALKHYLEPEHNKPATALALVYLSDEIEKLAYEYGNVIDPERIKRLRTMAGMIVELERGGE